MGLLIFLLVIAVVVAAWRAGGVYSRKINVTLREQNNLLEKFSTYWFQHASSKQDLSRNIAKEQNENLQTTLKTVLLLLSSLQKEKESSISQTDKDKISSIISTIKGISPE